MTRTRIEWATDTWNPVTGCTKVSEGCRHCYAERQVERFGHRVHSLGGMNSHLSERFMRVICHSDKLEQPMHWRKPRRVFVCSMSDLFHEHVSDVFINAVFASMARSRQHTFLVLTKRPRRMHDVISAWSFAGMTLREGWGAVLPNVWLGVSVENQATADERIPLLLETPAAVRFVSYEPALAPVNFSKVPGFNRIGGINPSCWWVICGGESGPGARPMHPDWARSMRDQCQAAGVPFFFKQWGEWQVASRANGHIGGNMPDEGSRYTWLGIDGRTQNPSSHGLGDDAYAMARVGKKRAGRMLDGRIHDEFPEVKP